MDEAEVVADEDAAAVELVDGAPRSCLVQNIRAGERLESLHSTCSDCRHLRSVGRCRFIAIIAATSSTTVVGTSSLACLWYVLL